MHSLILKIAWRFLDFCVEVFWIPCGSTLSSAHRHFEFCMGIFWRLLENFWIPLPWILQEEFLIPPSPPSNLNVPVANFNLSPHEIAESLSMITSSSHSQELAYPLACKLASSRWAILTKRFLMQVEFLALNVRTWLSVLADLICTNKPGQWDNLSLSPLYQPFYIFI